MAQYKLRAATIIDIIEKIPADRVETLMPELTECIIQAKSTYDLVKALDPKAEARLKDLI